MIEPSAGATRATLAFLCEAYFEEQLTAPEEKDLAPLREAIAAALKSIGKKMDDEVKRPREGGPSTAQFTAIARALNDGLGGAARPLLQIDNACALPGADRIELLKKVRLANGKLCDEHTRVVLRLHPALAPVKVAVLPLKKNEPGHRGDGAAHQEAAAAAAAGGLRRHRRHRQALPPAGRDRHAVLRHRRLPDAAGPDRHRARPRHHAAGAGED